MKGIKNIQDTTPFRKFVNLSTRKVLQQPQFIKVSKQAIQQNHCPSQFEIMV